MNFDSTKSPERSDSEGNAVQASGSSSPAKLSVEEVLADLRAGVRTKGFLQKYAISMQEFESLLKMLIRKGLFTKDEYLKWKTERAQQPPRPAPQAVESKPAEKTAEPIEVEEAESTDNVETFIINNPEGDNSWALQLFSIERAEIGGTKFKVNLHGRRYAFAIQSLIFRGSVYIWENEPSKLSDKTKREEALELIGKFGWAAYLEQRAIEANVEPKKVRSNKKARLVVLNCQNDTYLAALHTPAPTISVYVSPSLASIRSRLSKAIDLGALEF